MREPQTVEIVFEVELADTYWGVRRLGDHKMIGIFATKPHAVGAARRLAEAESSPSRVVVRGHNGVSETDATYGPIGEMLGYKAGMSNSRPATVRDNVSGAD